MVKRTARAFLVVLIYAVLGGATSATAAIPVRWTTDTYKLKPLVYECYHGETLDLASALTAYGEPLDLAGKTAHLYWQTNGMYASWWQTNATIRSEAGATNILAATFSGAFDTGANETVGFIGVEGENYRAAFTLRFRASPGFLPSTIPTPTKKIDWATVINKNVDSAPFVVKGGEGVVTPSQVTNIAGRVTSNVVTKAYVESLGIFGGADTNAVNALIRSYDATNLTARINAKVATYDFIEATNGLTSSVFDLSSLVSGLTSSTNYWNKKQESLPYQTNAIPASVITNAPWLTDHQSLEPATNYTDAVFESVTFNTNIIMRVDDRELSIFDGRDETPSEIYRSTPSAPVASNVLTFEKDGTAIVVTVAASGTLSAITSGWTPCQPQIAVITLASGATVEPNIVLVGYGVWPRDVPFLAQCVFVNAKVYVTPIFSLAQ